MPDLMQTQRLFAAALSGKAESGVAAAGVDSESSPAADLAAGSTTDPTVSARSLSALFGLDGATAARRIALYRGNVTAARSKALAAAYPVIGQIVGADFLDGLARQYGWRHPSQSGDLHEYGEAFGDFLEHFEPTEEFPYLSDLARLEWAVHCAARAADMLYDTHAIPGKTQSSHEASTHYPVLDMESLAAVPEDRQAELRLRCAPGTALLGSRFPIARIWTIHQDDYDGVFSIDWDRSETALVARAGWRVTVRALGAGESACLRYCLARAPLDVALTAALAADPDFDLGGTLRHWIGLGVVRGFDLEDAVQETQEARATPVQGGVRR